MGSNWVLFIMIQSISACVIGWIAIGICFGFGWINWVSILSCVAFGFLVAFPVASKITKRMTKEP